MDKYFHRLAVIDTLPSTLRYLFWENQSSLTTLSPGCLTKQFNSAVWPTMAVTFRWPMSSKSGLFKGLFPATTLARLDPPAKHMESTIKKIVFASLCAIPVLQSIGTSLLGKWTSNFIKKLSRSPRIIVLFRKYAQCYDKVIPVGHQHLQKRKSKLNWRIRDSVLLTRFHKLGRTLKRL